MSFLLQDDAFDLEYLSRIVDVKDTVHKAPLLLHLVELVVEKFSDSSDLHSELCHVHFVAKVRQFADYNELRCIHLEAKHMNSFG